MVGGMNNLRPFDSVRVTLCMAAWWVGVTIGTVFSILFV